MNPVAHHHLSAPLFTEADLAWDPPPAAPPTHLDLTNLRPEHDDESDDILADLEAVSTPLRAAAAVAATDGSPLSDLAFPHLPAHDVLTAQLIRRATSVPPPLFPAPQPAKAEMASPTDVAATATPAWCLSPDPVKHKQEHFPAVPVYPVKQDQSPFSQPHSEHVSVARPAPPKNEQQNLLQHTQTVKNEPQSLQLDRASDQSPPVSLTSAPTHIVAQPPPPPPPSPMPISGPSPMPLTGLTCASHTFSSPAAATTRHLGRGLPPPDGGVKKSRPRRSRKKSEPVPSRFCHICARTQKSRKMFCANLRTEVKCRKSVCEPCFIELGWDFAQPPHEWLCPHCRGICSSVPRARCHIYTRTNEKRKAARRS